MLRKLYDIITNVIGRGETQQIRLQKNIIIGGLTYEPKQI